MCCCGLCVSALLCLEGAASMEPFATPGSYNPSIFSSTCGFLWEVELFCFDSFSFCLIGFLIILIFVFLGLFFSGEKDRDRQTRDKT